MAAIPKNSFAPELEKGLKREYSHKFRACILLQGIYR